MALVTRLVDGAQQLVAQTASEGDLELTPEQLSEVRSALQSDRSGTLNDSDLFVRSYSPPLRLIIIGAVHVTQILASMARLAGFQVTVIDPRGAFARAELFPDVALHVDWPEKVLPRLDLDERTALVTFTHDPKIDDPALRIALASPVFYIGALGSKRTHAARCERLDASGELARIHGPIGLNLGGREPAEIAVATLAEIVQVRHQGATREVR